MERFRQYDSTVFPLKAIEARCISDLAPVRQQIDQLEEHVPHSVVTTQKGVGSKRRGYIIDIEPAEYGSVCVRRQIQRCRTGVDSDGIFSRAIGSEQPE